MISVAELRPCEQVGLDHALLLDIGRRLGPAAADEFLCRAMEEIAVLLGEAERAYEAGQVVRLRAASAQIASLAASIGMTTLERASCNMVNLSRTEAGAAALAAVCNRMLRMGEQSFMEIWALGDMSM